MNKVVHLFTHVNMQFGHKGLGMIAKKNGVDISSLRVGEFVLFANKSLTAMKLFAANNTVIHYKAPSNRPIDIRALSYIPSFFDGQNIGYDKALLAMFRDKYRRLFRELSAA